MLSIVHSPDYQTQLEPGHRFPMSKYEAIGRQLVADGLASWDDFHVPAEAPAGWLNLAHDPSYVDQVLHHCVPRHISRQIGFDVTPGVAKRARLSAAGSTLTARLAIEHGIACNTAGGSHHADQYHGAGFCVFNDVGVGAQVLMANGEVGQVLVFDCDVHQGDGTARIFADDPRVRTVSIHAEKNYPTRKARSDLDVPLPDNTSDHAYLEILSDVLAKSISNFAADLVFYNAGVDPHGEDHLGRLALTDNGLMERDKRVIGFFRERNLPLAGVLGGGYSRDINVLAKRHTILHRVASSFC